ncbi:tubulin polyglutamylase TTLL11 [Echinococcus multilocularis]|uniref:Tubulin polyglutamylase TTLL11 n=1 Tax=Echinococcus multilocularis TaxID=6211 RepID=A0A068XW86_ECHMU|nr:tubulin polyglutamylase TTLL11 [Echinococcus multilocularis]
MLSGPKPRQAHYTTFKPLLAYKPTDFRRFIIEKRMRTLREYSLFTKRSIRVQHRESVQRCALSVGTHFAGSNIDALRLAIQDLGFNEVTEEQDRDITWNAAYFFKKDKSRSGCINKFPGIHCLLTKISLFKCLEFQRHYFPEAYDFYPPTWFLPHQYEDWASYTTQYKTGTVTYIVKPSGGTQGKGIYLVQSPKEYCKEQMNARENGPQSDRETVMDPIICLGADSMGFLVAKEVVQQYEDNPVLVSGFKADLRIYVVLESIKPLRIHVYRDGLVRLASQRYHTPDPMNMRNSKMHLTNYSINKFPDSVDPGTSSQMESPMIGLTTTSIRGGSHSDAECLDPTCVETKTNWQCKHRLHHFIQSGRFETGSNLTPTTFWSKVDELIFGFDLLLVEPDCRPVLLEVNSSPSLRIDCMRPLVRYPSVAARQGLSPSIVVNSPKYSAFFRSRVDEAVKLGLLKATLLLMGSRIIHQRLLRYSPEKAKPFLEACGYKTPLSARTENNKKPTAYTTKKESKFDKLLSPARLPAQSGRITQRGAMGCSGSNRWMSSRISQIYCRSRAREDRLSERKKKRLSPPLVSTKASVTMPTASTMVAVTKTSTSIPSLTAPVWPPLRCPSIHTASGRQRQSEKLSEHFLSQPLSRSCRKARNRLHCIYAEDEIYPTSTGIFAEDDRECGLNDSNNEKVQFPQTFPTFAPTEVRKPSPLTSETMGKLSLDEKQPLQGDFKSSESASPEYAQPSPPTANSVAHLRIVDRLAEIFIHILSIRRPQCSHQKPPEIVDDVGQRSHANRPHPGNNLSFVIYVDPNGKTVSSHSTTANNGNTEAQGIVDVPIPRMDFTSFRMFTQRCKLKSAGISIREVDVLYMKHRLHWFRVFEPDTPSADTGLSFPAFVELCSIIAQKYFAKPSDFGDSYDAVKEADQAEPTAERHRRAFTAFVGHCMNALKLPFTQSPSPRTTSVTPKSLH